jgi:hypothetical protein
MSVNFPPNYFSPPTSTFGPYPQASTSAGPSAPTSTTGSASSNGNPDPLQGMDINQLLAMLGGGEATAGVAPVSSQSAAFQPASSYSQPSASANVDPYAALFAPPSAAPTPSATNTTSPGISGLPAPAGSLSDAYGGTTGPVNTVNQVSQAADPLAALFAPPSAAPAASAQPPAFNMAPYYPQSSQPGLKFNALA